LAALTFLGPESKTLYRIQNAMRYPHAMLPRCMFYALGIVCVALLLLDAQIPNAPPSKLRPASADGQIVHAPERFGLDDDIKVLTLSFVAKDGCDA
jgi:hypothetical protein